MLIGKTVSQAPDQMCWSLRFKGIAHDRSSGYRARHCRDGNTSNDHGGSAWFKVGTLLVGATVRVGTIWTARGIGASFAASSGASSRTSPQPPGSCTPVHLSAFEFSALVTFRSLEKPSLTPVSFFVRC